MIKRLLFSCIIVCLFVLSCSEKKSKEKLDSKQFQDTVSLVSDSISRTSITFILGKDETSRYPYFSLANQYYRINDSDKTEIVIDSLTSLLEVRNYLEQHPPKNKHPWGLINLVSHGNEFIDLSVKVIPNGDRTSTESLNSAIHDSIFNPLDSNIVDRKSLIFLHGCAVGQNKSLLKTLGYAFGGNKNAIKVKASRLFEYYTYFSENKNPQNIRHYYAKVWYGFYKLDSFPDENSLVKQLEMKYPDDKVNWQEAIRRQYPSNPSEIYHIKFGIPVVWEDFYEKKTDIPALNTKSKQDKWFANHKEFQVLMKKTQIPFEYYQLKFFTAVYKNETEIYYSNKVKARAGVICIIKPLLAEKDPLKTDFIPFKPHANDTNYFGFGKI
ncbi:MAG: hypothetical protein ACOYO1_09225 [Bacteroidales bacterium]